MARTLRLAASLMCGALFAGCGGARTPPPAAPPKPVASAKPPVASPKPSVDRSKLPAPGPAPEWSLPAAKTWKLSNGVEVYYLKQGKTPLVSLSLVLPRGSATDPVGKSGLTALTADMLDEGAGGVSALELNQKLQRLATDEGADVGVDYSLLWMNLLADNFERSTKILSDILERPELRQKDFARRKAQRIADALSAESDPGHARGVTLRHVLFGHGYGGEQPNGSVASLKRIRLYDVKAQYKKLFTPDGAALIVVGGIGEAKVKKGLEAAFGSWKGKSRVTEAKLETPKPKRAVYVVDFPGATQSTLGVVRRAGGENTPDYFPAMVENRAFGGAFTSRLNLNLREDKGYTYGASSVFQRWRRIGFYALVANVKTDTTRPSIDQMFKELEATCGKKPLTEKERSKAVDGLLLGFPGRFEHIEGIAGQLADLPIYGRPADWYEKWPSSVKAVTLGEANAVAKKYCDPKSYDVVIAGDLKKLEPSLKGLGMPIVVYNAKGEPAKKK